MKEILLSFLKYFLVVSAIIVIATIIFFFLTRKYSEKRRKLYAFLFSNTSRENMLISIAITNVLFTFMYMIFYESITDIKMYAYFFMSLLFCIIGGKLKLILFDLGTTGIEVLILEIYEIAINYSTRIRSDIYVNILLVLFVVIALVYSLCICLKKIELIFSYRNKRRKK